MKPIIVANWKCNPVNLKEAKQILNSVKNGLKNFKKAEVIICPPFLYLPFSPKFSSNIKNGSQNCFWEQKGAYTGEISASMLKDLRCQYVILGHSERRTYFGEDNETINKKIKAAFEADLNPILCVGETAEERAKEKTEAVLKEQVTSCLKNIAASNLSKIIIAYEPVWAIGSGHPCDVDETQKMGLLIRKIIYKIYNAKIAKEVPILYGGSVNSKNAAGYVKEAGLQGLLVGGASLQTNEFIQIVKEAAK